MASSTVTRMRSASNRPARGYRPFIYREAEQEARENLQSLIKFIYSEDDEPIAFWRHVAPILINSERSPIEEGKSRQWRKLLGTLSGKDCRKTREEVRGLFVAVMKAVKSNKPIPAFKALLRLSKCRLPEGVSMLYLSPTTSVTGGRRWVSNELALLLLWYLSWLRVDALRECKSCGHYFLRADRRKADYCSPPCRSKGWWNALGERQRRQIARRKRSARMAARRGHVDETV